MDRGRDLISPAAADGTQGTLTYLGISAAFFATLTGGYAVITAIKKFFTRGKRRREAQQQVILDHVDMRFNELRTDLVEKIDLLSEHINTRMDDHLSMHNSPPPSSPQRHMRSL